MDFNPKNIKLVIGLGNPESKYSNTYHNIGYLALERISQTEIENFKKGKNSSYSYFKKGRIIFAKPNLYMNQSGPGVRDVINYFSIKPEETAVIHDDSDISAGSYKISFGRGSAGHRGIQSIIDYLGTNEFWRIRLGIRSKKDKRKAEKIVLKKISGKGKDKIEKAMENLKKILYSD